MRVQKITKDGLSQLTDLHYEALPEEFLTSISRNFLTGFYETLYDSPSTIFLGTFENKELTGAIVCITDDYKSSIYSYYKLGLRIFRNGIVFVMKPRLLYLLLQSFFFKIKEKQETEIFFIGVRSRWQSKGVGRMLIQNLEKALRKRYFELNVDCKCKLPANLFYQKMGFKKKKYFTLYGEKWTRYEKNI